MPSPLGSLDHTAHQKTSDYDIHTHTISFVGLASSHGLVETVVFVVEILRDFLKGGGKQRGGIPHCCEMYNVCPQWCREARTVT